MTLPERCVDTEYILLTLEQTAKYVAQPQVDKHAVWRLQVGPYVIYIVKSATEVAFYLNKGASVQLHC